MTAWYAASSWCCAISGGVIFAAFLLHLDWKRREREAEQWREQVRLEAEEAAERLRRGGR